jgi:uncharacterized protein YggT (Ycf19 family)
MMAEIFVWLLWAVAIYLVLGFLTAIVLSRTPYADNGPVRNTLLAGLYWYAALRGIL